MKNLKLLGLFLIMVAFTFSSCKTYDDPAIPDHPSEECPNLDLLMMKTVFYPNSQDSLSAILDSSYKIPHLNNPIYVGQSNTGVPLTYGVSTNASFFDPATGLHGIFISRGIASSKQGVYTVFNTNNGTANSFPIANQSTPKSPTAPVIINGIGYVIQVNSYYTIGQTVNFGIHTFNLQNGSITSTIGLNTNNFISGSYVHHENISAATNGTDSIFYLSGINLIMIDLANHTTTTLDLYPSFNPTTNYARFFGAEYYAPGILLALLEQVQNNNKTFHLLKINTHTGNYTVVKNIHDMLNPEFYSTAFERCDQKNNRKQIYYLTTLKTPIQTTTKTHYYEFDLLNNSVYKDTLMDYHFGIELYHHQ